MSKTSSLLLIAFLFPAFLVSQDLIVTNTDDSIRCKMVKTKGEYLQFTTKDIDDIRRIPKEAVKYYQADMVDYYIQGSKGVAEENNNLDTTSSYSKSEPIDFLVMVNKDTVYGKIKYGNASFALGESWVTVKNSSGDKHKYSISEVSYFFKDELIYKPKPSKPEAKKYYVHFTPLIMQNGEYELYDKIKGSSTGPTPISPGYYAGGSRPTHDYYLFKGAEFMTKVTGKNYKEVLSKYFAQCEAFISEMNSRKNYFYDGRLFKLASYYRSNCS